MFRVSYFLEQVSIRSRNSWFHRKINSNTGCICKRNTSVNKGSNSNWSRDELNEMVFSKVKRYRRRMKIRNLEELEMISATYGTADQYKFGRLLERFNQDSHLSSIALPVEIQDAVLLKIQNPEFIDNNRPAYLFLFRFGVLSFWNVSEEGIEEISKIVKEYEVDPYKTIDIQCEREQISFKFINGPTAFSKKHFDIDAGDELKMAVEMYAFASPLATSVKLAHWEIALDKLIHSLEPLPSELIKTRITKKTSRSVLKRIGEIFLLRHRVNLQHSLHEVPDVFWDEEPLENVYLETSEFLNIAKRVSVMNEKLSYCAQVVELVKGHIAEQKTYNVEILIVVLIMIEVIFELLHFKR